MKILSIGDQHFKVSNINQVDLFIKKLDEYLTNNKVDLIVSMGDLLDTHEKLHTTPFNKALEYILMLGRHAKTFVLVGNHDALNNSIFLTDRHWLNCIKNYNNITVVDNVIIETINDTKIVLCPYVSDGRFIEALNTRKSEWEDAKYIFCHQLINKAKMGSIIADTVEDWRIDWPMVFSGHIHDQQNVSDNWYYLGACMQHSFTDSADKTILVINDLNDYEYIDLELPKRKILYYDIEDISEFDESKLEPNTTYKLYINGNKEEFKTFEKTTRYKEIKKIIDIKFKHKRSEIELIKNNNLENLKGPQKSFEVILQELIEKENNPLLENLFYKIVYNQNKNLDDIIILDD